ncbi:class III lanthionine synthetase LanKC [Streptomyces sp. S07_1.15]|uniref:class III lanthionine synthetase LanKC n=1 Tax=Streptomyces sp. S07_1.15 TaxID=2873925 RepID=UPI001D15CFF8|nr:class III lanthionine synthetase LanKC [Streptomyces sp. S07_1.15]MCC3651642.1 class III lanthionine synthetase LanKC [Streptomyces sp. S07_1.15]
MTTTRPQPEAYCQADPVFYDTGSRHTAHDTSVFPLTEAPAPAGWRRGERDVWVVHTPEGHRMPAQGWKIHISGRPDNARRIIETAWDYCTGRGVPFKFLRSRDVVTAHSVKYAPRSASGKLVTLYPAGEEELRHALEELSERLAGVSGPYILTDLRWGDGPLHVRYGAFVSRYCTGPDGAPVPAVERPDGVLVPDDRRPVFTVPDWVEPPAFLAPHLEARRTAGAGDDFPYTVERALHFSNGGGVYLARHRDGRRTVLKEARPHAGLDGRGRDAVRRLERERAALEHLAGIPGIPELYGHHRVWEHHFLAVEHLPGDTLHGWLARHYPLTKAAPDAAALRAHVERARAVADRIEALVTAVHERGMVFGDLHPGNILVDESDDGSDGSGDGLRVSLVDFELTVPAAEARRLGLANPGFSGSGLTGYALDRHALAALRLWLLFPLTALSELDPARAARYADAAERSFPLAPGELDAVRRELAPAADALARVPDALREPSPVRLDADAPDWPAVRKSMAEAILLSATPERRDRLFPGDVRQFHTNGLNVAYGAAGVLWALHTTGAGRWSEYEEWLAAAARRDEALGPGFYDGAHGIAHVLDTLGRTEDALRLLDRSREAPSAVREVSLYRGLAGIGLNLLHFAARTGTAAHRAEALAVAGRLAEAVDAGTAPGIAAGPGRGSRAGLLHGWSGPALFFLRLHQDTGDAAWLGLAVRAVHRDLALCRGSEDGSLQVDGGFRLLPYLDVGSAGIALVASEILRHRADARLEETLPALVRAAEPEFTIEPHLFSGRAGLLATLAALRARQAGGGTGGDAGGAGADEGGTDAIGRAVERHLARLHWHALSYRGQIAFPGEQLRRLSMDLATGNAGVLLALGAALDGRPDFLPFLAGPAAARAPRPTDPGRP